MARYEFVDHWDLRAPIETAFRYIADASTYPQWWPVYDKVEVLPGPQYPAQGARARLVVRSALGYRLVLEGETLESRPPTYLRTSAHGQLEGGGVWELRQDGDIARITWTWIVETHHPLLNRLEWLLKPIFAWSHNDASSKGHAGLKRLLEQ